MSVAKIKGVSFHKQSGRWRAYVTVGGQREYLGYFDTQARAAEERALAEMENPKPAKAPKVRAPRQETRVAPALRDVEPVEEGYDDNAGPGYDPNQPASKDNYKVGALHPRVWLDAVEKGYIEKWFVAGDWWRFHRYEKTDVWDAEVERVAALCGTSFDDTYAVMTQGDRDRLLADPSCLPELLKVSIDLAARILGVADLV